MSQKEIAFMGRIIASLSHEIKNVLATIKESAGLMDDILKLIPEKSIPHQDRLVHTAANIKKQVDRGADVVTGLNRFAHSMDEPTAEIELNAFAAQMAFLMQRFAHKSGVVLSALSHPDVIHITTDPFALEMLLASALDVCLGGAPKGSTLMMRACLVGGKPAMWIGRGENGPPETLPVEAVCPENLAALQKDLAHLHTHICDVGSPEECGLLILFQ